MNKEIARYRDESHYLHDVLHHKFNSDDFIRQILKGEDLHPFDQALRDVVSEQVLLEL